MPHAATCNKISLKLEKNGGHHIWAKSTSKIIIGLYEKYLLVSDRESNFAKFEPQSETCPNLLIF